MQRKELKDNCRLTKFELAFLILSATITITIVSTCSPLYPFNPWDDANCFFTLGRGIKHGLVPYRDLYDHKGPVIYFIYFFAALISEKSFIGIWIFECVAASVYAVFTWKTVKLLFEAPKYSLTVIPLFLGTVYTSGMFNFGGNAEELCFPLLTIAFFFCLRSIVIDNELPNNKEAFISGLITSFLFWIKYTLLGFMAAFILIILIISIWRKQFKNLYALVWRFLSGFVLITIPVILYFAMTKSLNSLWEEYFINNIRFYLDSSQLPLLGRIPVIKNIYFTIHCLTSTLIYNPSFGVLFLVTLGSLFCVEKRYRKKMFVVIIVTFALAAGFIFTKPAYVYYYGYILAYCLGLSVIPVIKLETYLVKRFSNNSSFIKLISGVILSVFFVLTLVSSKNMYLILKPKEFLSQYRVANTISRTENAKVVTYDVMDSGFFTAAGILPSNRFYCFHNNENEYTEVAEEKNRLIKESFYDYIITYYHCDSKWDNYVLIQEETGPYAGNDGKLITEGYKLYKKVSKAHAE